MKNLISILLVVVFTILATKTSSGKFDPQKQYVKNINLNEGLSQIVVSDLTIGSFGFLWAGTFDGLNRFDGSSIKVYRNIPFDFTSLPSSNITKLNADHNLHLYIQTSLGFCIFDCLTEKVIKPDFLNLYTPLWVENHNEYEIWIYTTSGELLLVNTNSFAIIKIVNHAELKQNDCKFLSIKKIGNYLYIVNVCGQVTRYDIQKDRSYKFPYSGPLRDQYLSIDLDKDQNIFMLSPWGDYNYFNTHKGEYVKPVFFKSNVKLIGINRVFYDSLRDVLFITTYGQGLFVYDYLSNSFQHFKKGNDKLNISSNYILSILKTKNGMLYLGYDGMGFDVIDPNIKKFVPITLEGNENKSLKFVRKIQEDDEGNLFIGTAGSGLIKYNMNNNELNFIPIKNKKTDQTNVVNDLLKVGNELWIGFNGFGVGIMSIKNNLMNHWIEVGEKSNQLVDGTVWSMLNDGEGNIWLGTRSNGMYKINIESKKIECVLNASKYPFLENNGIRTMSLEKNHKILVGTEKGLLILNTNTNELKKVFPTIDKKEYKSFESIKCIYVDSKKRTWLGTYGGGILILSPNYQIIQNLNTSNHLVNNVVYAILPENDSTVWISSNLGLSKIVYHLNSFNHSNTFITTHFDEINGLQSKEFNTGAYLKLKNGNLVFGGSNGINLFNPKEIISNKISPKVYISELKIFENNYKTDTGIAFVKKVNLKHFENAISIGFNTLGFTMPGKTYYQYRLVGYDQNWIVTDNRNYVSYTNLKYGEYDFQVRATTNLGDWEKEFTSLKIKIETPFYLTWYFIATVSALFLGIIYFLYKNRLIHLLEKEKTKDAYNKELARVEMTALRAQINPHFLFNSLNSINNFILKNDTDKASRYLVKFSQLIRNILNNSSSPLITLKEELGTIELYLLIEGMRFNNQFTYRIDVEKGVNTSVINVPSLLIQPFIENAIWHGLLHKEGEKKIDITVKSYTENSISISIVDNGIGRVAAKILNQNAKNHKSFGMQIGENRIRLMNVGGENIAKMEVNDLYDEKNESIGTHILIVIPASDYKD